jgi:Microtubule associated protein (MAP65/ASE1 family)
LHTKENVVKCFDAEVDSLNHTIAALKRELLRRHSTVNKNNSDQEGKMDKLQQEKLSLMLELELSQQENTILRFFSNDLLSDYENVVLTLNEAKEKLTVAEVSISQETSIPPLKTLDQVQAIWKELGLSSTKREEMRGQIENCLEHTCAKLLGDAQALKENTIKEISDVRQELSQIASSLEFNPMEFTSLSQSLLKQLEDLRMYKSHLQPIIQNAMNRRDAITAKACNLSYALDIPKETLDKNLILLLDLATTSKNTTDEDKNFVSGEISEDFLSQCEEAVAELQLQKSKIIIRNSTMQREILSMVNEMNLEKSDVIALVHRSAKQRLSSLPTWWNDEALDMVSRSVTAIGGVVRSSQQFSQHLVIVHESLSRIANVRRQLSSKLRSMIEHAQQTLLKTVDGEFDANSEYSNFHEELFRLPPLSKEFIQTCFTEIEALSAGVEVMSQSEIEALTVVCEALNISTANRGNFWESMDQLRETGTQSIGPFDDIIALSAADCEEWLLTAIKKGTKSYVELATRLFKLENIHTEVEQLRERQDSKSKIISLDTEVRILSAQLKEFEDKKCNKQRLTTKKSTSSTLLREERFRKQMQSKFTAKLEQLVSMLKSWRASEDSLFDQDLLSDEVRTILKNSDRNEFMHLRTVEYKSTSKRSTDEHRPHAGNCSPPNKRPKLSTRGTIIQTPSKALTTISNRNIREQNGKHVLSPCRNEKEKNSNAKVQTVNSLSVTFDSTKRPLGKKKKLVLDPFGNVLAQAMSPHVQSNKENV